ncbi:hypothetical protein FP2506_16659 [Fulvimarina pelagi HTCC2506]|uniref:Uncharacterized protein n=1 Tax=Fulvimarina pelagi HTCC2506 TaxID=314231 RepID=Q0G2U8_9HYPH|nr:hypothetical protein FP2506_16659 [Fulvimarina pelagi HTCC2506]
MNYAFSRFLCNFDQGISAQRSQTIAMLLL